MGSSAGLGSGWTNIVAGAFGPPLRAIARVSEGWETGRGCRSPFRDRPLADRNVILALHHVTRSLPTESLATIMLGRTGDLPLAGFLAFFWSFSGRFLVVGLGFWLFSGGFGCWLGLAVSRPPDPDQKSRADLELRLLFGLVIRVRSAGGAGPRVGMQARTLSWLREWTRC